MNMDIEALRARNDARRRGTGSGSPCATDIDDLLHALDDARAELHRLTEDSADLKASAGMWADLYAASVDRANAAEAMLRAITGVPGEVQRYYALLDAVAVLTEALESVVLECAECAAAGAGNLLEQSRDHWCARCVKAIDALRATPNLGL